MRRSLPKMGRRRPRQRLGDHQVAVGELDRGGRLIQTLMHDLATGNFLAHPRNVVLVGGTGTGRTHLPSHRLAP